jgi:D-serine dehydratase
MDNIGQIKAILLEYKLITIKDFDKINISFDSKNVYIKGVELKNSDFVEAEKRLKRKLVLHNS